MGVLDLFSKFDDLIAERAAVLGNGGADPFELVMDEVVSATEAVVDGRPIILAGTYNYMGMTFDPDVIAAGHDALDRFGSGTTGSRVLNGTYAGHKLLEQRLADFYGTAHAMVFSTGYQANLGICSTLAGKGDYILLDADCHASIYDGCAMGSADIVRFRHNNAEDLARRLRRLPAEAGKLVVLEGVYSMLGDRAPLADLVRVAKDAGAMVLVDEAHAMGFIGERGRGVTEAEGVEDQVDFIVGTFSKSVGTVGGYCVSNHPKFEVLRLVCRPYMFTASLPPSVVATAAESIRLIQTRGADKRQQLWDNSRRLHGALSAAGFQLGTERPESAIIAVVLPDLETAIAMWQALLDAGVYVNVARPPATPFGMVLLRCSLCAAHRPDQIDAIVAAFLHAAEAAKLDLSGTRRADAAE
ncbi:serine palmitoyltransferase [Rhodothalassium salexigens]|uniref:serine palmitoyltransferase n=1 Tax=Rhodothalassium salexigens TaxID=1086 RepID=UPI00161D213A